ncbi:MAG: glutathione S-transferase [Oleispira sp.]|nr:glutathione S-transferase [Oleispira sp.]
MSDCQLNPLNSTSNNGQLGILYSFRRCPYAIRARLACTLFLPQQSLELREVVLKNKPPQLLEISPKATVPVLQLADRTVIDESRDIIFWALNQTTETEKQQFHPLPLQAQIDQLIDENDGSFKWALDHYKYADRYDENEELYREMGEVFLVKLEGLLEKNRYLLASQVTLADIAVFPFVRQFAHVDKKWFEQSPYPKLILWYSELLGSELFKSIMKKHKPWNSSNIKLYFPNE